MAKRKKLPLHTKVFFINSRAKHCDDDVEMLLHGRKNEGNKKKERKKKKMK
jgi:hypothetical protein